MSIKSKLLSPLVTRICLFLALFILISYVIGQKIVASPLLYDFGIFIYGGMGYILLFSIAGFILLYGKEVKTALKFKFNHPSLVLSAMLAGGFYVLEININKVVPSLTNIILVHALFLSIFVSLIIGIFGFGFIKGFFSKFKRQLLYFLSFGVITYSLMHLVWSLWPYLSFIVTKAVFYLLSAVNSNVSLMDSRTIVFNGFAAQIAEACSGIYSIFLFTALYLFIVLLDWKKINKKRAFVLFIPAVIGAFLVNILRVFLLFVIGAYVSRSAALGLYHSYTGMIFFLVYFAVFWVLFYKFMKGIDGKLIKLYKTVMKDSLYKNSVYLIVSTFIMSVLGFIFWIIIARLYPVPEVGLATTIISVMGLITSFSLLGLNTGLIRYLPKSERKNNKINSVFTLCALVTIVVTVVFILAVSLFSPRLHFIKENLLLAGLFIIFMVMASLSSLIESIFLAYRETKYTLSKNIIFSGLKIIFPVFLITLGAYGIFSSWMLGVIFSLIYSFIILYKKFGYRAKIIFYDSVFRKIGRYSFANYIAGFLGGLPSLLLPLIITTLLMPETTAYYYIAMMIATLLFVIPGAASNSLFAEGSYEGKSLKQQVKKATKIIALLLIPGIIITVFLGNYILLLFGKQYSAEGFRFLQILAVSGIFIAINGVYGTLLKVRNKISKLIIISILNSIVILGLSLIFIKNGLGLLGIGYAWITGQALISLIYLVSWRRK